MAVRGAYWVEGSMAAETIKTELFTHLFCAFADIDRSTYKVVGDRTSADANQKKIEAFIRFNQVVHQKSPAIRTLLSIGGAGEEGDGLLAAFASMARTGDSRATFISSSIQLARDCGFDGLDLDYEIPETAADMTNVSTLLYEWRAAVQQDARRSSHPELLLTAAVRYTSTNYNVPADLYPAESIVANLDWINVMTYDYTTSARRAWGSPNLTAPAAALYGAPICGSNGVNAWIQAGVPGSKIVFGIPFYGYGWKLVTPANNGFAAPADGPLNGRDGAETYRHVAELLAQGAAPVYDPANVTSYCYKELSWISYDGTEAVAAKVAYARETGLLGYFAWQLAQDDANSTLAFAAAQA